MQFIFNFNAFDFQAVQKDLHAWAEFVEETDDMSPNSWNRWYTENYDAKLAGPAVTPSVRLSLTLRGSLLLLLPLVVSAQMLRHRFSGKVYDGLLYVVIMLATVILMSCALVPCLQRKCHGRRCCGFG
eukprot:SAG22_NODE_1716_length_3746_cov_1.332602_3_plen_128_part_00